MPFDFNRDCRSHAVALDLSYLMMAGESFPDNHIFNLRQQEHLIPPDIIPVKFDDTEFLPRRVYIRYPGVDLILIRGVRRGDTARALGLSYLTPPRIGSQFGCNNFVWSNSGRMWEDRGAFEFTPQATVWICGHSYGGALAQALAFRLANRRSAPPPQVRCVTFGAPRTGSRNWPRDGAATFPNVRYFADNDPVRHMPPHADEAPLLHAALPRAESVLVNDTNHLSEGRCLRDSGVIEIRPDTPETRPIGDANLVTWITGMFDQTNRPHQFGSYHERIFAGQEIVQPMVRGPMNAPRNADPIPEPPPQAAPVVQAVVAAAVQAAQVRVAAQRRAAPAGPRFAARRRNRVWVVVFGGETLGVTSGKVHARSVARRGNLLIRTIDWTDPDAVNFTVENVMRML